MAGQVVSERPTSLFEFELVEAARAEFVRRSGELEQVEVVSFKPSTSWQSAGEHSVSTQFTASAESAASKQPSRRAVKQEQPSSRHRIGRGPFGDVWLATHHSNTEHYKEYHEVAIKMLHPICIVMKFYKGSVGDKMARYKGGKLPLSDVLRYGADLAQGIMDLHAKDILILNLKPCNFLLNENDRQFLGTLEFLILQNAVYQDGGWMGLGSRMIREKPGGSGYTEWFLAKDHLQVGDMVRSRKSPDSCNPENMDVPKGAVVGLERDTDQDGFVLKEDRKHSPVGGLHSITRDGSVAVTFIGLETLWKGSYSEFQMAKPYCVGQFITLNSNVFSPRFEWPRKRGGEWATGRICQFLADPAEGELVSFDTCPGMVKKYQHLEDFHWAVRPLSIALGVFTSMKFGLFIGRKIGRSKNRKGLNHDIQNGQNADGSTAGNT
ncbi:unnamed protein product [Fraxinus pennsylvanica]|uniref:Protein kinase domain-containing protein n=1 Tax=Fraxinus pennsylvanica TaxID=56036 RepID=A0AAD1ZKK3_9LAMI|nr:unnamed protein product [Fraxinus pennsylvanica]